MLISRCPDCGYEYVSFARHESGEMGWTGVQEVKR